MICRVASTPSRVSSEAGEDRVPFFVRPALGARTADVALLMPTATYMAYANHRTLIDGADFMPERAPSSGQSMPTFGTTERSASAITRSTLIAAVSCSAHAADPC